MYYPKADFCPFNTDNPEYSPSRENERVECPIDERELQKEMQRETPRELTRSDMEQSSTHDTRCEMMKKIDETEFAVIDLNLFLDTHPDCAQALELFAKLAATLKSLKSDYQARYGPLYAYESKNDTPFQWVEPGRKWPWEI